MGYDFAWSAVDPAETAVVAEVRKLVDAAVEARNAGSGSQEAVTAAYDQLRRTQRSNFRLNIWGMSRFREYMAAFGMLCNPPVGQFPNPGDYGVTDDDWDANGAPDTVGGKQFMAARDEFLASHPGECPGIPRHKFGSNDGWRVTPAEILAALRVYDQYDYRQVAEVVGADRDYWSEWIDYLHGACTHDGFAVW